MRADQLIVARGLAPSRSAAQRLISRQAVRWLAPGGWAVPRKPGEALPEDCSLEVTDDAELRYVSRGGLKLAAALDRVGLDPAGSTCLDLGQSTGGFTDVLLQRGALRVVGVDVGHGQLHPTLVAEPRVTAFEGLHVRDLAGRARGESALDAGTCSAPTARAFVAAAPQGGFDVVVADLSFISVTHALPAVKRWLAARGQALLLAKPQFELQPADIGKGGLVKDPAAFARVEARLRQACDTLDLVVHDYFESAIEGGDGNREFFARLTRRLSEVTAPDLSSRPPSSIPS